MTTRCISHDKLAKSIRAIRLRRSVLLVAALALLTNAIAACGSDAPPPQPPNASPTPDDDAKLRGHWEGVVAFSDSERVQIRLELARLASGWVGEADAIEMGAENYPVEVWFSPPSLRLEFAGSDASFEGILRKDNGQIAGALRFGEEGYGLELTRSGEPQFSPTFLALEASAADSSLVTLLSANAAELRAQFQADSEKVRLIVLLAPT